MEFSASCSGSGRLPEPGRERVGAELLISTGWSVVFAGLALWLVSVFFCSVALSGVCSDGDLLGRMSANQRIMISATSTRIAGSNLRMVEFWLRR